MLILGSGFLAAGCANASGGGHSHRRQQQHLVSVPWELSAKHDLVTIRYQVPTCTYAFARTTARRDRGHRHDWRLLPLHGAAAARLRVYSGREARHQNCAVAVAA